MEAFSFATRRPLMPLYAGRKKSSELTIEDLTLNTSIAALAEIGVAQGYNAGWLKVKNFRKKGIKKVSDLIKNCLVITVETDYGVNDYLIAKQAWGWTRIRWIATATIQDINLLLSHINKEIPSREGILTVAQSEKEYGIKIHRQARQEDDD